VHPDREYLKEFLFEMREICHNELLLELNDKTQVLPLRNGINYLGWRLYLTETGKVIRKLSTQGKKRTKRLVRGLQKGYADGLLDAADVMRSINSLNGHLCHGHTYRLREKLYRETVFTRRAD